MTNDTIRQFEQGLPWSCFKLKLLQMESCRGLWFFVGHIGIGFRIIPRFETKLMIKIGATKGIRVSQFGPLVVTWEERQKVAS